MTFVFLPNEMHGLKNIRAQKRHERPLGEDWGHWEAASSDPNFWNYCLPHPKKTN